MAGNPGRPLVVLLHGICDAAIGWSDYIDYLSEEFRVVSVDMLGHGLSPRFTETELAAPFESAYRAFEEAVEYIEAIHGMDAVIVAHSMGGAIATMLAARRPELCRGLVVEDPAWLDDVQRRRYKENAPDNARLLAEWASDPASAIEVNRRRRPSWPVEDHVGWAYGAVRCDPNIEMTGVVSFDENWHDIVSSLDVPLLVVSSDGESSLVGRTGLDEIEAMGNPQVRTAFIPGCEHVLRRSAITMFNDVVTPVLRRWWDLPCPASGDTTRMRHQTSDKICNKTSDVL